MRFVYYVVDKKYLENVLQNGIKQKTGNKSKFLNVKIHAVHCFSGYVELARALTCGMTPDKNRHLVLKIDVEGLVLFQNNYHEIDVMEDIEPSRIIKVASLSLFPDSLDIELLGNKAY